MEQRLSLITLGVADVAASRAFYERLGWTASTIGDRSVAFFQLGGAVFSLYDRAALAGDAHVWGGFGGIALAHNVRRRDEVAATLVEAERAGARILRPATAAPWGGHFGFFADPDSHLWEVAWNPDFSLGDDGNLRLPR